MTDGKARRADRPLRILMMIHRQADNSPYCFYVHEQAKALRARGHDVTVISCVGVTPMMERLRPAQASYTAAMTAWPSFRRRDWGKFFIRRSC